MSTGRHQALFKTSQVNTGRPIALVMGLMTINYLNTFIRKYYCPNPIGRPSFHVTDFEAYTPDGVKVLLEFLGNDKAAYIILSIE
jgi:hypothetical protein